MPSQIDLAVARLSNKTPQLFSVDENFKIHTTWRSPGDRTGGMDAVAALSGPDKGHFGGDDGRWPALSARHRP